MKSHTILLIILITSSCSPAIAQSLCFDPASDNRYATEAGPMSVAWGDFNEDGERDAVSGNAFAGSVSIFLGLGDGSFEEAYHVPAGSLDQVESADMNMDSHWDLVFHTHTDGAVSILFGNGDGTFDPLVTGLLPGISGDYYNSIELADFNDDGDMDIAVNGTTNNNIYILTNDGAGNFTNTAVLLASAGPQHMDTGDLDGNGYDDLVCSYYEANDNVSIFYNNGNGTFDPAVNIYAGIPATSSMEVLIMNLDADTDKDICVAGFTTMYLLRNNGNGTFTSLANAFMGSYAYDMSGGDWEGDGDNDLVWSTKYGGSVGVILNNGDGTFPSIGNVFYSTHGECDGIAVADFNNDNIKDVVAANTSDQTMSITNGNGDGTFGSRTLITRYGARHLTVDDFNNDTYPDVIGVNYLFSDLNISLGSGDGNFQDTYFIAADSGSDDLISGDWNEDDNMDVATFGNNGIGIQLGDGTGQFQSPVIYLAGNLGGGTKMLSSGDFNNDNHLDIAGTFASQNQLAVLMGNGDGTFDAAIVIMVPEYPRHVVTGKLNNDDFDDIVTSGNSSNNISIVMSNGNGTFQAPQLINMTGDPDGLDIFDANGDTYMDILVACSNDDLIRLFPGNGNGTFDNAIEIEVPASNNLTKIAHGDINGDGETDIVGAFYQTNSTGVFIGNGDGTFQPALTYVADQAPDDVMTSDFNGDGSIDIAVLNTGTNNISVILNNSAFIDVEGDLSICENESVIMTASEGYSYLWSNGETTQSIDASADGEYYCEITNQSGTCTLLTPSVELEVYPMTTVTLDLNLGPICLAQDPFSLYGGSPFGGNYSGPGITDDINQFDPNDAGIGTHIITYTYSDVNGCTDGTATDEIEVVDSPEVSFAPLEEDTLCINSDPITFSGGLPAGGIYTVFDVPYITFDPSVAGAGSYEVSYVYEAFKGCVGSASQVLVVELCDDVAENLNTLPFSFQSFNDNILFQFSQSAQLSIFDIQGKLTYRAEYGQGHHNIDTGQWTQGIYMARISIHGKNYVARLSVF